MLKLVGMRQVSIFSLVQLTTLGEWILQLLLSSDSDFASKVGMVLWSIWGQWNCQLWNQWSLTPARTVESCSQYWSEWLGANSMTSNLTSRTPSLAAMAIWKKPPDGSLKCNCDAALFEGVIRLVWVVF